MRLSALLKNRPFKVGRKEICIAVLAAIFFMVGMAIPRHITVTKTDSVRYHIFWEQDQKVPTRGSYVRLPLLDPSVGCIPCSIVKRIGCMPSDSLTMEGLNYYCNGQFLGQAKTNITHSPFVYTGIIPSGMVFLIGDKETSYDSRYFGLKALDDIETVLRPLF